MNRMIALHAGEPGCGLKTVSRSLAGHWAEQGRSVLWLALSAPPDRSRPGNALGNALTSWLPRFKNLTPVLLRNYLCDSEKPYAELTLFPRPSPALLAELLNAVHRAFEWTLVLTADILSTSSLPVLDEADLLLWISRPHAGAAARFQAIQDHLTSQHLPLAYSQAVYNRIEGKTPEHGSLDSLRPGSPVLGKLAEEAEPRLHFREGIRRLAKTLEERDDIYKRRDDTAGAAATDEKIEELKKRVQPQLLEALSPSQDCLVKDVEVAQKTVEAVLAQDANLPGSREARGEILARVLDEVLGLGPLEPLLKDPSVSEVMVNGKDTIYAEKRGKLHPTDIRFSSEKQLRTVIDRIVAPLGRRVDESMPLCDARLADGSRVNIVLPPLALDGACVTIRKFMAKALGFEELVARGSMSAAMADFLRACVVGRRNIVVAGGTGSGKTTLLNALSSVIPDDERIVTIEDAAELRLPKPHVVRLESRPPNAEGEGAIPIRRLVINALRMRPDRIVVGECRSGEALDMLQAMNTGHDGSLTTVHANSPRDALGRLETLVLMAGMDLPVRVVREQIRSAVHLIVQQARLSNGLRKITSITEVTGMEGDTLTTQELYRFRAGAFEATGLRPRFSLGGETL